MWRKPTTYRTRRKFEIKNNTFLVVLSEDMTKRAFEIITFQGKRKLSKEICLTLILLTWRKWWASNNASKQQMGFNSAFKGLIRCTFPIGFKIISRYFRERIFLPAVFKLRIIYAILIWVDILAVFCTYEIRLFTCMFLQIQDLCNSKRQFLR